MDDCIFCKIVNGDIPCYKVYEDDNFLAFLNIYPYAEGHTLVIPKKHYRWVWDVENAGEYMEVSKTIANNIKKGLGIDLIYSLVMGNEVPHAHIHLIPGTNEKFGKGLNDFTEAIKYSLDKDKVEDILNKIKF